VISKLNTSRSSAPGAVGLDIEPDRLVAATVQANGSVLVERSASVALAPGIVRDGEVVDASGLSTALQELFRTNGLDKRVRIGVANQRIVVRAVDLPKISDQKELDAAVRFQAQEHIPMPMEQAVLDWHSLGVVQTEQGERTRVVLVAARRDMIERLLSAVRSAGLRPVGIDLAGFAMIRALEPNNSSDATLYVGVGGLTNVAVAEAGSCRFTRVAGVGLESISEQLAERRALTLEQARETLVRVGLEDPVEELEGDPEVVATARETLVEGLGQIASEVRNSAAFFASQPDAPGFGRVVLTGPAAAIPGFATALSADLQTPVETRVVRVPAGIDGGMVTVAAGLAIEDRS
jgi:type IV pilus assembly protein PilM